MKSCDIADKIAARIVELVQRTGSLPMEDPTLNELNLELLRALWEEYEGLVVGTAKLSRKLMVETQSISREGEFTTLLSRLRPPPGSKRPKYPDFCLPPATKAMGAYWPFAHGKPVEALKMLQKIVNQHGGYMLSWC